MQYLLENIKKGCFINVALIFGCLISGCVAHEPQPVILKELKEIQPKQMLQREKSIKQPGPPPFAEKMEPVAKGLVKDTRLYSLLFENAPLGAILNAIVADTDYNLSIESGIQVLPFDFFSKLKRDV
jgi:hypothetical protein